MLHSVAELKAFIEVARSGSFTRAAETLCVSQSAISKRIQSLEEALDIALFIRTGKKLSLSAAGNVYLTHANEALALLESGHGLAREVAGQEAMASAPLEISASPAFATHWLIARLPDFHRLYPSCPLSVRPRLPDLASTSERFDIAIRLGAGRWANARSHYLLGREMALVASPALLRQHRIRSIQDLQGLPLLHRAQRGYDWHEWAQAMAPGQHIPMQANMVFEGFSVLIPAIKAGLGFGICPLFMVQSELQSGELARPFMEQVSSRFTYHVVLPKSTSNTHVRDRFLVWLKEQADTSRDELTLYLDRARSN
ncbi:LysR substrate-binding domain-containing protein [Paracandidimonas soli]|uniref:DNA-binding transcriptional LysR family regulator n=2 Tax=Paracandidimonas soli TaxID=1917182 RepID=A0A4R3UUR0_9BURK|nr:LysR substrate-binding domain-containing protein [Paracandidimonas soli]TCU94457.1 DNA-binding transcriptional LysR family regulator [Paracandidimonas soli]